MTHFPPFEHLTPPYGDHVMTLQLRSYEHNDLDFFIEFVQRAAANLNIPTSHTARLPTSKELHTVIKSAFVHKKKQENFARLTHRRVIKVYDTSPEVLDLWLRYIRKHSLPGIGAKAYINEAVEFGFASDEVHQIEEAFSQSSNVERLANQYISAFAAEELKPQAVKPKPAPKPAAAEPVQAEAEESATAEGVGAEPVVNASSTDAASSEAAVNASSSEVASDATVKAEAKDEQPEVLQPGHLTPEQKNALREAEAQIEGEEAVVDAPTPKKESETPKEEQPEVLKPGHLTPEQKNALREAEAQIAGEEAVVDGLASKEGADKPSEK